MANANPMPPLALLAGGLATRLRPATEKIPKSMIEVAGEPFIAHQLRLLKKQGIQNIVICLGHLAEQVQNFVGEGAAFGVRVKYSLDGDTQLGTGGALKKALPMLGEDFLVMYGDSYLLTPIRPAVDFFHALNKLGLMTVFRNEGNWDTSNVVFSDGILRNYDKKNKTPDMAYIDYGLGAFRAKAFMAYPAGVFLDLADIYRDLLSQGQLTGYEVKERFYEIGSHEGIRETDALLKQRNRA